MTAYQIPLDNELIVDNFAGGGGASTGIEMALNRPVNIAINHDREALAMHEANHPLTQHFCEDVFDVNPRLVTKGRPVALAWFSPDCKHFSKAKGGQPVNKKIRGLAWVALRWAATAKPRIIVLENVEEFTTWGPVVDGNPCPKGKGRTFRAFINALNRHGYVVEYRELRACDFGAPTIRKRLFLIARCDGQPIVWPKPTHGPGLLPHRTAAECIDWSLPCPSIFERKRPLAENTQKRIARGIKKFVIDAQKPFIVTCNHGGDWFRGFGLDEPMRTVTCSRDAHGLVVPFLQHVQHASAVNGTMPADEPLRTITAHPKGGGMALAAATLIQTGYGERPGQAPRAPGLDKPLGTVVASGQKHAVVAASIARHFGQSVGSAMDAPLGTLVGKSKDSLLSAFVIKHFGGQTGAPADKPFPTILSRGTQNQIATCHIMKMRGENTGSPADEPLHTVSAQGTHHALVQAFLIKYYGTAVGQDLQYPMHTVTTKERLGLVTISGEEYDIVDIGMRMLVPRELYRAQGFPDSYQIDVMCAGKPLTKTAQVRMCGNSVSPLVAKAIVQANMSASIFEISPSQTQLSDAA